MRTRSESKHQAIIDVATEVFREHGFERTSMSEICARVGGSKATLYSHFASKELLFFEVVVRAFDEEFELIFRRLEVEDGDDVGASLGELGKRLLRFIFSPDFVPLRRLVFADPENPEFGHMAYTSGPQRGNAMIASFLARSMARGRLRAADAHVAAWQLQALLQAELFYPVFMGAKDAVSEAEIDVCVHHAVDVFMRAYAPETACPDAGVPGGAHPAA